MTTPLAARVADARRQLHAHYGFADFRPLQRRTVQSVLAGRDVLAVLPTGAGKSVCYQVPALVLGGLTLVVSPLVALMEDQVRALVARGVPAATLHSLQSPGARQAARDALATGRLRLLYVSPERLTVLADEFAARGIRPSLLAVDEAHCISEWGDDFRPSYRALGAVRARLGAPPALALTGSATPEVRADIIASLGLVRPDVHLGSFDRPNLRFDVLPVASRARRLPLLFESLAPREGLAIVYAPTRNTADGIARALRFAGFDAAAYHAGLSAARRQEVLERFLAGGLGIVAATSAFGMGIDAPGVRLVAHWGIPASPEAYYQEAGRAGRDGRPARCLLLHHPQDIVIHRRQLAVTFPPRAVVESLWHNPSLRARHPAGVVEAADRLARELAPARGAVDWRRVERRRARSEWRLRVMERYAQGDGCRRRALLGYFGERVTVCGGCDGCARRSGSRAAPAVAVARRLVRLLQGTPSIR